MPGPIYRYDADSSSTDEVPGVLGLEVVLRRQQPRPPRRARSASTPTRSTTTRRRRRPWTSRASSARRPPRPWAWTSARTATCTCSTTAAASSPTTSKQSLWKISYTGGPSTPSAAPRAIPIGDFKVNFLKGGSGGVSYKWEFGDGQTSTDANPTHTYAEAKRYTAKLTVTYADGVDGRRHGSTSTCSRAADEAAPTTTHTITPAAPTGDGTYKKPVTITLTATDTGGIRRRPHGVPHQRRRVDGLLGARDPSAAGRLHVRVPLARPRGQRRGDQDASRTRSR